jgi:hypothetical protein
MSKETNQIKYVQYTQTLSKLNKALKQEFYYEAIMLDYSLIEDRMTELLLNLGFVNKGNPDPVVAQKAKKSVRKLLGLSDNSKFGINKISVKIDILTRLCEKDVFEDAFLNDVSEYIENKIGKEDILDFVCRLTKWKDIRNGYVHGLMDKVPSEIEPELKSVAEKGKELFRKVDSYCKKTEKRVIRKKYRINPIN